MGRDEPRLDHGALGEVYGLPRHVFAPDDLALWAERLGVRLPTVPSHCENAYHMFYLLLPSAEMRDRLITHLRAHGILAVFHYLPLHLSDMGKRFGGALGDCPVTEDVSGRLVRLPFYNSLSESDQQRVIATITRWSG